MLKEKDNYSWYKYYNDMKTHIEYPNTSMYSLMRKCALKYPSNIAYTYFGNKVTYKSFLMKIDTCSRAFIKLGVKKSDVVSIIMPNTPEAIICFYALNRIGAICNMIHPLSSEEEFKYDINLTSSKYVIVCDLAYQKLFNIKDDINVLKIIYLPISESMDIVTKLGYKLTNGRNVLKPDKDVIMYSSFLNEAKNYHEVIKDTGTGEDTAAILHSGGTTGKPKGIIISNANFNAMALQTASVCKYISPGYSVLSALPIFHVFGLALCTHTCLVNGMKCIIVPQLNTKKINKELKKYKPSVYPAVPSLLKMSIDGNDPGMNAFKDIKVVVVGGDYLSPELKKNFEKYLKDHGSEAVVKVGYGLSEACGFCCCTAAIDEKDVRKGTLGIPNPDMIVKIFEPNSDIEKSTGDVGEICINGPTLMMGYINESKETKDTLVEHHDGKIWLHTGDLGYMDKDGFIFYTSRMKRMIISNGYNIYPIELEEIINKCKLVDSCTVIGIPHKIKSQTPKAVIVLKKDVEDNMQTREQIRKYCYDNIAKYARPSEYEFRTSLPKTAVGKVAYKDLEKKN